MAKYPPLLPKTRTLFVVFRAVAVLMVLLAVWAIATGDTAELTTTELRILIGAIALVVASWMSPYSPWFLVFLAVPIIVFPISGATGIAVFAVTVGVFVWLVWRRTQPVILDPAGVRRVDDDAVMPGAIAFVEEFERLGWSRIGAVGADLGKLDVTMSGLMSPDRTSYVEVTDLVIAITSVFTDGRTLVTRNSGGHTMGDWVLANDMRGASPTELAQGHRRALEILRTQSISPQRLEKTGLVDFIVEQERASIGFANGQRPKLANSLKGVGPLDDSEESLARIKRWQWKSGPDFNHLLGQSKR